MFNLVLILYLSTLFSVAAGGWYNPFARSSASILDAGAIQQSNVEERLRVRHRLNNLYTQQRRHSTAASFRVLRLPPLLTTHQLFPLAAARPCDPLPRLLSLSLSADAPSTPRNGRNATTIHGCGRSDDKRGGVQRGRRSYRRARAAAPSAATSYCASVRQRR